MFRTEVPIKKSSFFEEPRNLINFDTRILSIGSCFAENISEKLTYLKFQNTVNPFGIIFNPVSIEKIVKRIVNQELYSEQDVFFHNEMWHCFEVHSKLSSSNKELFLSNLNQLLKKSFLEIQNMSFCVFTYGTSWVYRNNQTKKVVANCHKFPQNHFTKELLSPEVITKAIENTIHLIQSVNKKFNFIFTVSPVRHIKDGFFENNVSKANLITSIYSINVNNPASNYFPSYEILLDELRDYRFYANDMLHPSQMAIEYIWNKFRQTYINPQLNSVLEEVENIQKSLQHKPFNVNTESHKAFISEIEAKIKKIETQFPHIKF